MTSRASRRAYIEKVEAEVNLLPRKERRKARMKAFDDSGVADTPSFRRLENQFLFGLCVLLVVSGWWLSSATNGLRRGLSVLLLLGAVVGIGFILLQRTRPRVRRRQAVRPSPNEPR